MRFECYSEWSRLPAGASSLFEQAASQSLFFSRPWFETLHATALEPGQSLLLAAVVEDDALLALLPLVHTDDQHYHALIHRYSALYSLLLAEQEQQRVLACLVAGLARLPFRSLRLKPVAEDDSNMLKLQQAMADAGYECHRHFQFYNWIHRTRDCSFDDYMAARPARLRNTIARKRRKLEREHGCEIRLFRGSEVEQGLADYHAAYSASWKALEQYGELLDALAVNLSAPDWTRLAVLYIDSEPAAAQLWFVVHKKASIFRLAYNEAWKPYSPGSILTAWLMHYVIDTDRVQEIDFLTGNEAYKQDWMSERRERASLVFFRRREGYSGLGRLYARLRRMLGWLDPV